MPDKNASVKPLLPLRAGEVAALRERLRNNPSADVDTQIVARLIITAEVNAFLTGVLMYRQRRRAASSAKVRRGAL